MFDGHGSVFPAPDHLIFHGLARCCLKVSKRFLESSSLSQQHLCGMRSTSVVFDGLVFIIPGATRSTASRYTSGQPCSLSRPSLVVAACLTS